MVIDRREFYRGDIYWFDNEYEDESGRLINKPRPGIIVSNNDINKNAMYLEIVWTTTAMKKPMLTHVTISSTPTKSIAMCERITSVEKITAGHFKNNCTEQEMREIEKAMIYGLAMQTSEPTIKTKNPDAEEVTKLKIELAKARAEADLMKTLYRELLQEQIK